MILVGVQYFRRIQYITGRQKSSGLKPVFFMQNLDFYARVLRGCFPPIFLKSLEVVPGARVRTISLSWNCKVASKLVGANACGARGRRQ